MAYAEGVIPALFPVGKTRKSAHGTVGMEGVSPAGKDFVSVGLVTYIPEQLVVRGIENIVQRDGELNYPQAGAEMPPVNGYDIDDVLS